MLFFDDVDADPAALGAESEGVFFAKGAKPDAVFSPRLGEAAFETADLPAGRPFFPVL